MNISNKQIKLKPWNNIVGEENNALWSLLEPQINVIKTKGVSLGIYNLFPVRGME